MITPTNLSLYAGDGYNVVNGWAFNDIFGVTDILDETVWPYLIIHLQSGSGLVWCRTLDVAERLIDDLLEQSDIWTWDEDNPINAHGTLYGEFESLLGLYKGDIFWTL